MQTYCDNPPVHWLIAEDFDQVARTIRPSHDRPKSLDRLEKVTERGDTQPVFKVLATDVGQVNVQGARYPGFVLLARGIPGLVLLDKLRRLILAQYIEHRQRETIYDICKVDTVIPHGDTSLEAFTFYVHPRKVVAADSPEMHKQIQTFYQHLNNALSVLRPE